jgi:hypothetical protein
MQRTVRLPSWQNRSGKRGREEQNGNGLLAVEHEKDAEHNHQK